MRRGEVKKIKVGKRLRSAEEGSILIRKIKEVLTDTVTLSKIPDEYGGIHQDDFW